MNTIQMYDAQADSINIEDIATNDNNRLVLNRMKRNDPEDHDKLFIHNQHDEDGEACEDYVPEGTNDMGWLGYFIGKNNHLNELGFISPIPPSGMSIAEVLEPFLMGVSRNKSIHTLNFECMNLLGGRMFTMLNPFFENGPLVNLYIYDCHLGDDGWRLLAFAIGCSKNKSLKTVSLRSCNTSDEGSVDIITALSIHPHLKTLELSGTRINIKGCMALSTLLRHSATQLRDLDLGDNEIDDDGVDALIPTLKSSSHLETLILSRNGSITSGGWKHFASILEAPNCNLTTLGLVVNWNSNVVNDEVVTALASALVNNYTLTTLGVQNYSNPSITDEGWKAISELLCDTSSINSTYLSNHTLQSLGITSSTNPLQHLFNLNKREDTKEIAMIKIIQHHDYFDMLPFFEWEFKVLPLMIKWFERASSIGMPSNSQLNIGPRKLSSIYQFVRSMPLLYVETVLRKELEDIKVAQAQMKEAMRLNEERKRIIMDQLGR